MSGFAFLGTHPDSSIIAETWTRHPKWGGVVGLIFEYEKDYELDYVELGEPVADRLTETDSPRDWF